MYKIKEEEIRASPEYSEDLTFDGNPVTLSYLDGEVYISCKTIKGTLTEIETFFNDRGVNRCFFGGAKIRLWTKKSVRIDCLEDNILKAKIILLKAKTLKYESDRQSGIGRKTKD